ncbi:MAG: MHS family MFS transporter [Acidimicrobiaceae bacterium]|nr:MHS family MFS transporter [Acidimicrobiaceae bacterium]
MATSAGGQLDPGQMRRVLFASTVGTAIEWYDYFVYGTVGALVFPKLFFPKQDATAGILDVFAIFFIGFLARPVGAFIFGHFGDRIGRKATLIATLTLTGLGTALMGVLPGHDAIGVAAPLLLVVFRIAQGIGVGGEWGGSVTLTLEHGAHGRRGWLTSWPQSGGAIGLILSTLIVVVMQAVAPGDAFLAWGWRVPFLVSVVLIGLGLWVRLGIFETPVFRNIIEQGLRHKQPLAEVIRRNWREICLSAVLRLPEQAPFYVFTTFVYTFGGFVKVGRPVLLWGVVVAGVFDLCLVLFSGHLSDTLGRKRVMIAGAAVTGIWGFIYFALFSTGVSAVAFIAIALSLVPHAFIYGPQGAFISESFTGSLRMSGASVGYQLASIIAGGPAPLIATAIWAATHNAFFIGLYILGCSVFGIVAMVLLKDRSKQDITVEYEEGARAAAPQVSSS